MLLISSSSQLVVSYDNDNFIARDKGMATYLKQVMDLFLPFKSLNWCKFRTFENVMLEPYQIWLVVRISGRLI